MFNSSVVDVCIGLIFTAIDLGLLCTTVNEWLAQVRNMRSKTLKGGIETLLDEPPSLHIDAICESG